MYTIISSGHIYQHGVNSECELFATTIKQKDSQIRFENVKKNHGKCRDLPDVRFEFSVSFLPNCVRTEYPITENQI